MQDIILVTPIHPFGTAGEPAQDAFVIVNGEALVFIEKVVGEEKRRTSCIATLKEGQLLPGFSHKRGNEQWGFYIVPKDSEVRLERMESFSTKKVQQSFLSACRSTSPAGTSFEDSLTEIFHQKDLTEMVSIIDTRKRSEKTKADIVSVIHSGFAAGDHVPPNPDARNDLSRRAVEYACRAAKIPVAPPEKLARLPADSLGVTEIAKASGFLCRDVVLDQEWYHHDCGVIISEMDGVPVACIPKASGRYVVYRSDNQTVRRLNKKSAHAISPSAHVIGRALPKGKVDGRQVRAFALRSILPGDFLWVLLMAFIGVLIGTLLPTLNQKAFDEYIPLASVTPLFYLCGLILAFTIGNLFFNLTKRLSEHRIASRVSFDLQNAVFYRIFRMPESFFRKHSSADLAQRVMGFGSVASTYVNAIVVTGISTVFSLIYLFQMMGYSGSLTAIALLMVALYAALTFAVSALSMKLNASILEEEGEATGMLYQFINGIDKIRMAGCEQRVIYEYMAPYSSIQAKEIRKNRIDSISQALGGIISSIFSMVLYFLIVKKKIPMSIGTFMAFNTAFGSLSSALLSFTSTLIQLYALKPTLNRLKPILDEEDEGARQNGAQEDVPGDITGAIQVENVSFAYEKDGPQVLNNISLSIAPGQYVGIVGPSGCGKSTLMKLLLGFETPDRGRICYDGYDMARTDRREIRKQLGVVLQNGGLISGSIHENITITNPKATMRQVREVIKKVGLKEDIDSMPMGIHTVVSESASMLSGGQQQRILIARAIINNPRVLLFDEATSALDNVTQKMVCDNLDAMKITRVVIAHRLSTIEKCDRILFLNNGRIEEQGTYEQLMANRGLFYQMAVRQLHGDEEEET